MKNKQLEEDSILSLLLKFSLPAIVGMLVQSTYNIVDRIFIGRYLGAIALSGVGVAYPVMTITNAFGMFVSMGTAARISIALGKGDKAKAEKILGNAFILVLFFAFILTILGLIFINPILIAFGGNEVTLPYAKDYLRIILVGTVVQNLSIGLNRSIAAEGNPKLSMYTMLIGAVVNTILDPIFIFYFNMGVKGAAYATVISQIISTIWVLYHFTSSRSIVKLKLSNIRVNIKIVISILSIGMSPFAMNIAASVVQLLYNVNLSKYGDYTYIAAYSIINSIILIFITPIFGINQGAQPIIGYNYGAKNYSRVKKSITLSSLGATLLMVLAFGIIQLFPQEIIHIFDKDNESLLQITTEGIRLVTLMLPIIGFQMTISNTFQAMGKASVSMFLALLRQVIILIPLIIFLPKWYGVKGIWLSTPISDAAAALITAYYMINLYKDLRKKDITKNLKATELQVG